MSKRILIMDDDKALCEELADYFQEAGFDVDHAQLPEQGIGLYTRNRYDVLLLDFKMPQFDGIEFLKRSKEEVGGVRIFLISGSLAVPQMLKDQGLSALVEGVFSKPFDLRALHSAIKDVV